MQIRCKSSNRFLANIDTKSFFEDIKKMTGINIEVPLKVKFACRHCRMIEVYDIYKDKYIHLASFKNKK